MNERPLKRVQKCLLQNMVTLKAYTKPGTKTVLQQLEICTEKNELCIEKMVYSALTK